MRRQATFFFSQTTQSHIVSNIIIIIHSHFVLVRLTSVIFIDEGEDVGMNKTKKMNRKKEFNELVRKRSKEQRERKKEKR